MRRMVPANHIVRQALLANVKIRYAKNSDFVCFFVVVIVVARQKLTFWWIVIGATGSRI
jgi:hypothetical protein